MAVTRVYIAVSFTESFIEIFLLKPHNNPVKKELLDLPILQWRIRGRVTSSGSQSSQDLAPGDP